jgi:hypothetical protein
MSEEMDVTLRNFSNRSFRRDDAEAPNREEISQTHLRISCLRCVKQIMPEDEPERFVTFGD